MRHLWISTLAMALTASGCAGIPAPSVLAEIDRVRESPSAKGAERDAPVAFAAAEKLRVDARRAFDEEDDASGAQILGERALAAYEEAVALARVVRADKQQEVAAAGVKENEQRLSGLDRQHQEVAADIAAVEGKLKVLRSLEGVEPSGPAGPAREKARWQAVGSLHLGARLLCSAAKLLTASRQAQGKYEAPPAVAAGHVALADLASTLATKPTVAPIDAAARARSACLTALTHVRRGAADPNKAAGSGDALLEALSKLGHSAPIRDDRGVVVTLRNVFDGDGLSASGKARLDAIGKVGKTHGRFPVMVVLHDAAPLDDAVRARSTARGSQVVGVLRGVLGENRVAAAQLAGDAAPVVDPSGTSASRNARVDVVFVSPENL